ncbi:MAG: serine/threonine-protein phosphatase, partial [Firmicutes bacterium]|nr:serine/threonine-protein phosphatase [Bacillota bacterium]
MPDLSRTSRTGYRNWPWSLPVVAVMLAAIWALDHFTAPLVDMSILYFLPVAYAAWSGGRPLATAVAAVALEPTYTDQALLLRTHVELPFVFAVNLVARFLVYLFVAEVTIRLTRYSGILEEDARRLDALNTELNFAQERSRTALSQLEEDLRMAGMLQESALAFRPPVLPGCRVGAAVRYARPVGGDYADAGIRDGRVYACVADISGKGIPAALFAVLLEHLVKDATARGLSPTDVVAEIDSAACQRFPPDRFVTLFYAEVEAATGRVEYVNAGHPEGLICRAGSGRIELAGRTCSLLGVPELRAQIHSATVYLEDDDTLVIFTDGAIESETVTGGRLGDEPIRAMVRERAHLEA